RESFMTFRLAKGILKLGEAGRGSSARRQRVAAASPQYSSLRPLANLSLPLENSWHECATNNCQLAGASHASSKPNHYTPNTAKTKLLKNLTIGSRTEPRGGVFTPVRWQLALRPHDARCRIAMNVGSTVPLRTRATRRRC